MKAAPVLRALSAFPDVEQLLVHTGQHYDASMSDVFFRELEIPHPDCNLEVGSGSHAQQTANIMSRFEPVVLQQRPDIVVVYGDVNSTLAAALVCSKLGFPVAHVEAGLRSFDRTMPEEINRIVTDGISDVLLTPSADADENLRREGVDSQRVFFVGNVMIDTLLQMLPKAEHHTPTDLPGRFALVTMHRPSNVDDAEFLREFIGALADISQMLPVVFPIHPRTRQRMAELGLTSHVAGLRLSEPLSYLQFLALQTRAKMVITDSGGIQEETTYLGIPCLTMRDNTERPTTITLGTNILIGRNTRRLRQEAERVLRNVHTNRTIPPLWDGHAAERIAAVLRGRVLKTNQV
jgi:UDP-N-acetylglucosamine 2-epimerase (non-hydrolysing)